MIRYKNSATSSSWLLILDRSAAFYRDVCRLEPAARDPTESDAFAAPKIPTPSLTQSSHAQL